MGSVEKNYWPVARLFARLGIGGVMTGAALSAIGRALSGVPTELPDYARLESTTKTIIPVKGKKRELDLDKEAGIIPRWAGHWADQRINDFEDWTKGWSDWGAGTADSWKRYGNEFKRGWDWEQANRPAGLFGIVPGVIAQPVRDFGKGVARSTWKTLDKGMGGIRNTGSEALRKLLGFKPVEPTVSNIPKFEGFKKSSASKIDLPDTSHSTAGSILDILSRTGSYLDNIRSRIPIVGNENVNPLLRTGLGALGGYLLSTVSSDLPFIGTHNDFDRKKRQRLAALIGAGIGLTPEIKGAVTTGLNPSSMLRQSKLPSLAKTSGTKEAGIADMAAWAGSKTLEGVENIMGRTSDWAAKILKDKYNPVSAFFGRYEDDPMKAPYIFPASVLLSMAGLGAGAYGYNEFQKNRLKQDIIEKRDSAKKRLERAIVDEQLVKNSEVLDTLYDKYRDVCEAGVALRKPGNKEAMNLLDWTLSWAAGLGALGLGLGAYKGYKQGKEKYEFSFDDVVSEVIRKNRQGLRGYQGPILEAEVAQMRNAPRSDDNEDA